MSRVGLRGICTVLLLSGLVLTSGIVGVRGAGVNVLLDNQGVMLRMTLDLRENYSALPLFHIVLDSSNSTSVLKPIEAAVQDKVSGARVESVVGAMGTRLLDSSTGTWLLEENYTVRITGASASTGGQVSVNMAFLSLNTSEPMILAGREINRVGAAYLVRPLLSLPTTSTARWIVDGAIYFNTVIPGNTTQGFSFLDFSWVPSLRTWSHSYDLTAPATWMLTPAAPYNVTVGLRIVENVAFPIYFAAYSLTLQVTAPPRAWFENGMIKYDVAGPIDLIIPVIIAVSFIAALTSFVLDRRLTSRFRSKRRKR